MAQTMYYLPRTSGLFLWCPEQIDDWHRTKYLPCSLTNVKVKASIVDMVSRITLSQTFFNDNADTAHEALYRFPLYENSAVCGFEMEHSGRKIMGIVQAEAEAIKTYETAKAEGKTAALVLQKEADIFQTKVGNIPPKTSITVTLTYITSLKQDTESNAVRFTLPTAIAPRYGDGSNTGTSNVKESQIGFELSLDAKMPGQITSMSSPSHAIAMTLSGSTTATVTLSNVSPSLDKDVVLLVASQGIDEPRCVIETHPTKATKCAMFTLIPKFNLSRASTEVIFIIDRSGSMQDKVDTLKRALQVFLKSLPASPEIYFNICSFGSHFDFLFKDGKSKKYDANTLATAETYVSKVDANYGGTEILRPLLECMKNRRIDCQTSIILLTDGQVYNTGQIINSIGLEKSKHKDKPLRVFSLGIGDAVSHHLVEGIARAGDGYSQLVMGNERLDKKVVRMLSAGIQAPLNDLHIDWPGKPASNEMVYTLGKVDDDEEDFDIVEKDTKPSTTFFDKEVDEEETMKTEPPPEPAKSTLKAPQVQQFPETIPRLYNASRHTTFILFPSSHPTPQNITLKGTTPDGTIMSLDVPVTEYTTDDEKPVIHTLAARTLLGELEEGRLSVQQKNSEDDSLPEAVKQEGIRIGLEYGLASKWTSFVAVDEESTTETHTPSFSKERAAVNESCYGSRPSVSLSAAASPPQRRKLSSSRRHSGQNIHLETSRSESVEYLADKSQDLSVSSKMFYQTAPRPSIGASIGAITGKAVGGVGAIFGGGRQRAKLGGPMAAAAPPPPPAAPMSMKKKRLFGSQGEAERDTGGLESFCVTTEAAAAPLSAPGGAPGSSSTGLTDEEKLHEIIMQQESSGAFPSNAVLARHIGFATVDAVNDKLPQALKNVSVEIWMTVLVCVFLEQKLASEKEAWEMVVEKAWAWIDSKVGVEIRTELRKAADDVIVASAA